MRVISWNCNGAFRKKHVHIEELSADLYCLQEAENPLEATKKFKEYIGTNYLWIGNNKSKGILVYTSGSEELLKLDWPNPEGLELFLPFVFRSKVFVAVWTKQAGSPTFPYIGQFWKYLKENYSYFKSHKPIIIGDFNSNVIWDKWDRWWNHSDVVRILTECEIESLYHFQNREPQGKEVQPTFYMHRNIEKSYHIDYAFLPSRLLNDSSLSLGNEEFWLNESDHLPLIIDIKDESV